MQLVGQLKEDILQGKAVLFLGAGASQASGLPSGRGLADHLYQCAGRPLELEAFRYDLPRLVAKLDKNSNFSRRWVNKQLIKLFVDDISKLSFDAHRKLFDVCWSGIFTTNFDLCLECAENSINNKTYRLLPLANPAEEAAIVSSALGVVKYFKMHGCCKELEQRPQTAPPLVLTQSDFRQSIVRNRPFLEELKRLAYDCSIIFVGFQAQREENNFILANVIETYNIIASSFHQPFKAFTILKDIDEETKSDIEEAGLTLIHGTFEEFLNAASELAGMQPLDRSLKNIGRQLLVKAANHEMAITVAEHKQYIPQFTCYYEGYILDIAEEIALIDKVKLADLWKTTPSNSLLAAGYYIERTLLPELKRSLEAVIKKVAKQRVSQIYVIWGKRAAGKSVFAQQLLRHAYEDLHQPALSLAKDASYTQASRIGKHETVVSGWDVTLIDKFLSNFFNTDTPDTKAAVPVFLADHLSHRIVALDYLMSYLENHGKPGVLILTLNDDEFESLKGPVAQHPLLQLYNYVSQEVPHKMDDNDISSLFNVVGRLNPRIHDQPDLLMLRAKSDEECARDILLILYTWFDAKFRRLDEIITEQIDTLNTKETLRKLYLAIAVFHQYNFSPRVSLCAEALEVDIDDFTILRRDPVFKSIIEETHPIKDNDAGSVATRHSEFSRRILQQLLPLPDEQVGLMCKILSKCSKKDSEFARNFLNYVCRRSMFSISQATQIKEATEVNLKSDFLLNHQFGAYLIRERTELELARYYLDLALQADPENSAIIHSLGNLCYKKYQEFIGIDENKAMQYFEDARLYFERARALEAIREEHSYFTDIDMTRDAAAAVTDFKKRTILKCEQHALTFEALRVVPSERQNLLREKLGEEVPFQSLSDEERSMIKSEVSQGKASTLLLEYYISSLIIHKKEKNWNRLKEIISFYWNRAKLEPSMAVILCHTAKKAFILNSNTRFEFLRMFFDSLVRYRDIKINFRLLAEYVRMIQVDAFVLKKYDFLHSVAGDIIELFRHNKPRFQKDEYILEEKYYCFDETDTKCAKALFTEKIDFKAIEKAQRFNKIVDLDRGWDEKYFRIKMDPFSPYYLSALKKETALKGRAEVSFLVKHTYQGLRASGFNV
jgi:hypothetical protein